MRNVIWMKVRDRMQHSGFSGTAGRTLKVNSGTIKFFCAVVFALLMANCASGGPTVEDQRARSQLDILNALTPIEQPVEDWLPLTIAAIQDGTKDPEIWAAGRSKVPSGIETKAMRIASISKLPIAYGAMALVERGVLDLDEDISTYLGWSLRHPEYTDIPITVRHLLSHQSSLVDGAPYQAAIGVSLEEMMSDERFFLLGKAPGAYFTYANIGYGVLATVMEAAAQQRFDLLMAELVFAPAGLDIGYNWHGVSLSRQAQALPIGRIGKPGETTGDKPVILVSTLEAEDDAGETQGEVLDEEDADAALGEDAAGDVILIAIDQEPIGPWPTRAALTLYTPGSNASIFSPQGGLRASIGDVVKLGELLSTGGKINGSRILKTKTVRQMMQPQWRLNAAETNGDPYGGLMTSYGLGVHIYEPNQECFETKQKRYYGHYGEAYGLLGGVLVDIKADQIFAYLLPYTPQNASATLSECSGLYKWEEQFLSEALAPRARAE